MPVDNQIGGDGAADVAEPDHADIRHSSSKEFFTTEARRHGGEVPGRSDGIGLT
jgi:hypothetical protein